MRRYALYLVLLLSTLVLPACLSSVEHSPKKATKTALLFLNKTVFEDRLTEAYKQTHSLFQRLTPIEKFNQFLRFTHADGYPTKISTTYFEISESGKEISVLLEGKVKQQTINYKVTLIGSKQDDYQILGVRIDTANFDEQGVRQKFKKKRSIRRKSYRSTRVKR